MDTDTRAEMRIRTELLSVPGSLVCGYGDCQVITQGGEDGLAMHQLVIHGVTPCQ